MNQSKKSVLVVGFNTRPIVFSLYSAGYELYAVDFFGDLDLYPYLKDCIIITEKLGVAYDKIKNSYSNFLTKFTIEMLNKYPKIDYLIIGSGLDDAFEERELILNEVKKRKISITSLNNETTIIRKARNIEEIYKDLKESNYRIPQTKSFDKYRKNSIVLQYPFIFKKRGGSGGINVYKVDNINKFSFLLKMFKTYDFNPSEWLIQEYIKGVPISCTVLSNGKRSQVISINRQIIGERYLNSPKEFMYCGNIVPANLNEKDCDLVSRISLNLANKLKLKGLNGFDYVLKDHYPYLMEINPRIPGSIRASESAMDLNLLDLHIKSFSINQWKSIKKILLRAMIINYTTKLIIFAPRDIRPEYIKKLNKLKYVHDKTVPNKSILKGAPICTVLYKDKTFSDSYFGALKIVDKVYRIIQ